MYIHSLFSPFLGAIHVLSCARLQRDVQKRVGLNDNQRIDPSRAHRTRIHKHTHLYKYMCVKFYGGKEQNGSARIFGAHC